MVRRARFWAPSRLNSRRPFTTRQFFVWLHRWVGLLMTVFLVLVALTGSLLAFNTDLEKLVSPQLFAAPPRPDARPLNLATLAELAEAAEPHIRVAYFRLDSEQVFIHVTPRVDPITRQPYKVDFNQMFLDPWTGGELGHRLRGDLSQGRINLMPFIYRLHESMALGSMGAWVLGIVALAWTIDCFVAFYLTFPVRFSRFSRFLQGWKTAWKVKWPSSTFRLNFDLHRASGLWLWPMLFIFAWSSVMFNLTPVYEWTTAAIFDYPPLAEQIKTLTPTQANERPRLGWHEALQRAEHLMDETAKKQGFTIGRPNGFGYLAGFGVYVYNVESSINISEGGWSGSSVWVDGNSGALQKVFLPTGEHSGNTVTNWLRALHFADLHGWLAYRILVFVLGIIITMLSVTGVYIWWKKFRSRRISAARRLATD